MLRSVLFSILCLTGTASVYSQSTMQDYPTPLTGTDLSGTIKARDIGDSRLTTYYYLLKSDQGDLFVNLVTRNFTGDIDVFTAEGLKPMTKIVVFADNAESETGRVIYLRKPEKLMLRVQGRTPNDDDATFRLKFGGSFAAMSPDDASAGPELPKAASDARAGNRVNSVGTILPSLPKPVDTVVEKAAAEVKLDERAVPPAVSRSAESQRITDTETDKSILEPIAETPAKKTVESAARRRPPSRTRSRQNTATEKLSEPKADEVEEPTEQSPETASARKRPQTPDFRTLTGDTAPTLKKATEPKADPLASINLIIQLKDGTVLERKMSEVTRFSVDKGVLVVVLKAGGTARYPILEVAKVTIE